jgi:DNA-binding HxlR family transcriptional regulator
MFSPGANSSPSSKTSQVFKEDRYVTQLPRLTGGHFSVSKERTRAGAQLLLMAADPVKRRILREMIEHPLGAGPGHEYRVTGGGREVLFVGFVVERWLRGAPRGPLPFGSREAERAVAALAGGWSTTVMHALARKPATFGELHDLVDGLSRRALKRQLAEMRDAGQVEDSVGDSGKRLYEMTAWLRAGIAPLIASARLERREPREDMAPIDALDVEAGFRCSLPLVDLPKELSGTCRLGINLQEDESGCLTGVTAQIEQGRIVSVEAGLDRAADAWAAGSAGDWLETVVEPDAKQVRTGGDRWLTRAILESLHRDLFGIAVL